ncbi:hypothetical protein E5082_22505 [Streptomyces griseoluteus]|uniref:Uncharacterized protein n=1 Tax=Streptomyces griseoluteus TaxID=29306 RepID=A0A4Z1DDX5_STRGP|nr:hypothetical protein [Streptomyces griseoluteus]TGN80175.1 hypothetical protein E5082_22505 [Streptomyces griseoluteus]GHE95049.1 hypothetical protein GCM10017776_09180 [Streptomyces griseoluteus]
MFTDTPIFSRLVAERGDVPAEVRGEADRIHRDLARVMPPGTGLPGAGSHTPGPMGPPLGR